MSSEMFGLFVFDRNSQVVYRFTNSAVSEHLEECFKRRYKNQYGDGVSEAVCSMNATRLEKQTPMH